MKKLLVGIACVAGLCFASCGSTQKVGDTAPKVAKTVNLERIDWKGAAIGSEPPAWVEAAINGDWSELSKLPQLAKKKIIPISDNGKDLDLLKSWANNFDIQHQISKELSAFVTGKFGGELSNTSGIKKSFQDEIVAAFSRTEINGLSKSMDYWVQLRKTDKIKDTIVDEYRYFAVYSIDQDLFNHQIRKALGLVKASNEAEEKMIENIDNAVSENQIFAERVLDSKSEY